MTLLVSGSTAVIPQSAPLAGNWPCKFCIFLNRLSVCYKGLYGGGEEDFFFFGAGFRASEH